MPKSTFFQPKKISSFIQIKRSLSLYQQCVHGFKRIGPDPFSWLGSQQVTLNHQDIVLGSPFYDEKEKTIYCLLAYHSERQYLDEQQEARCTLNELNNINKALKLSPDTAIQFVGLGMGHEGIMLTFSNDKILKQLIKQFGPLSDMPYQNIEYPVESDCDEIELSGP